MTASLVLNSIPLSFVFLGLLMALGILTSWRWAIAAIVLLAIPLSYIWLQHWLSTTGFLDKIDENLKKAMAA